MWPLLYITKRKDKVQLKMNTDTPRWDLFCITYLSCPVISYQSCSCISYNNILSLSSSYLHVYHYLSFTPPHHTFIFIHFIKHSFSWLLSLRSPCGRTTHFLLAPFSFYSLPFAIHSFDPSPPATGRPVQHGKALTSCTTTFWISPAWTLWAAVAASPGQRPRRIYQRTRIMTVYGRLTVTGWALFLVRAPTSPTKTKPSPHSSFIYFEPIYLFIIGSLRCIFIRVICIYLSCLWFRMNLHFIVFCRCVHFSKAVPCCLDILKPLTLPTSLYSFIYLAFGIYLSVLWKYDDVYSCCPHYRMYLNGRRCLRYSAFGKQQGRTWEKMLKSLNVSVNIRVLA